MWVSLKIVIIKFKIHKVKIVASPLQVTDLKDMPKRELRVASNQILSLFQDNYPEMVARKVNLFFSF